MKEGPTYESQYELNTNTGNTENTYQIPHPMTISGSESRVFFDLETTGLGKNSEIAQIAAKVDEGVFQKYVFPRVDIQLEASKVTGITYSHSYKYYVCSWRKRGSHFYTEITIRFFRICS